MTANGSALLRYAYDNLCAKTDTGNKIKHSRIPKNTETQKILKRILKIPLK